MGYVPSNGWRSKLTLGLSTFCRRYFEELFSRLKLPYVIVFDNFQEASEASPLHDVICCGLSAIPDSVKVIIISRKSPSKVFARFHANSLMEVIGWDGLRLTYEEAKELIRQRKVDTDEKTFRNLYQKIDGWAAGFILMNPILGREMGSGGLQRTLPPHHFGAMGRDDEKVERWRISGDGVFDYFAGEVFDKLDSVMQEFLLKAALLPWMTAEMTEKLTGLSDSNRILVALHNSNYFTEKRSGTDQKSEAYQFHPLFREFLLSKGKESFSKSALSEIQAKAAGLLQEAGYHEDAVGLFHDAADREGLIRIILSQAQSMIMQGRYHLLEGWIREVPEDIFRDVPWLCYWLGACRLPYDQSESIGYFEISFQEFRHRKDAAGVFLSWCGVMDSIAFSYDRFDRFDKWIPTLDDLIQEFGGSPSGAIEIYVASAMFTALCLRQPHHSDINIWLERALTLTERGPDINIRAKFLLHYLFYNMLKGEWTIMAQVMEQLNKLSCSRETPPLAIVLIKLTEALYYNTISHNDLCLKAVEEGLDIAEKTGIHYCDFMIMGQAVICCIRHHDFKTAGGFLKKMTSLLSAARPWDVALYHHILTLKAIEEGETALASQEADTCLQLTRRVGAVLSDYLAHLLGAMAKYKVGEREKSRKYLESARALKEPFKSPYLEFMYLMNKAWFVLDSGKDKEGLKYLEKGFAIGRQNGYMSQYTASISIVTKLCMRALEAGIEVEYARSLIRHHHLMPESPPFHIEAWPWPLKLYTFGRFGILKDDKPVKFSGKVQQRPLAMLKALIAYGSRGVSEDIIMDALWPEALGDVARQSFWTTLHRLRKLMECEGCIQYQERHLAIDQRYCWVDSWGFERLTGKADASWQNGARDKAVELSEKGNSMYRGTFLPEEINQSWSVSMRERLRGKFIRNVERLGIYWEQKREWQKAIECYQKGIEVDNLAEEFYQSLMTCYQGMGRKAEAIAVYKRWKRILSSSIEGIAPSPKTEAIYRSLVSEK